jgi:hypothetical protein
MPLVLAPPLNLQRTLSPAVHRLPALLGCEAKESAGGRPFSERQVSGGHFDLPNFR